MPSLTTGTIAFACLLSFVAAQETAPVVPANIDEARRILAAMPVQEAVADGVVVCVVDSASQQPVVGADVYAIGEPTDAAVIRRIQALAEKPMAVGFALAAVQSTRYRTKEDGCVSVAASSRGGFLVIAGDRVGFGRVGQTTPIEVFVARSVDVVVRTADGKPVRGAAVAAGSPSAGPRNGGVQLPRTDREGRVRVEVDPVFGLDVLVCVLGGFTEPCEQKIDLRKLAAEPVALTVPPCGQVRFILYGPDEKPAAGIRTATLRIAADKATAPRLERSRNTTALPDEVAPDNVVFSCVEIGREVVVTVEVEGMVNPLQFRGKGPARAGELVVVEGRMTVGQPIVSFRLVDAAGQPVAKERVGLVVRRKSGHRFSEAETDAAGRLALPLQDADEQDLWVLRRRTGPGTDYRGAVHRVCGSVLPGTQDLGDLQFVAEPVAVRGRLVDGDGKPIEGVWLRGASSICSGNGNGSRTEGTWFFEHRVRTAADGTFEVHELDPVDVPLRLTIEGRDWIAPVGLTLRPAQPGVQEHRLWPTSSITARFAGADLAGLTPQATLVHRETGAEMHVRFQDGAMRPLHWAAGTYDLKIGESELAWTIEGIRAPAGGEVSDERLRAITPPEGTLIVRATVVDETDRPVPGVIVWCSHRKPGGGSSGSGHHADKDGRVVFLARNTECDVAIKGGGFATQEVPVTGPDLKIRVQRVTPLRVRFAGLPTLLPEVDLHVSCLQDPANTRLGRVLEGDTTTLQFNQRGTWHVRLVPVMSWSSKLPLDVKRAGDRALGGADIRFEVEATGEAAAPTTLTLSKEQQDDLVQRLQKVKEILAEQKDG